MGICSECGIELKEGASFCGKCGATIYNENVDSSNQPQMNQTVPINPVFVEGDETAVASLGNGVLKNMVTGGGLSSLNATLTDRRLYVCGKCLDHTGLGWRYSKISRIIDVDDVTGTGFLYITKPVLMIFSILFAIGGIISAIITASLAQDSSFMSGPSSSEASVATFFSVAFFIVAIVLFIMYFLTKKNIF